MANSNFVVHNGLTVGPLTIDAATGSISTTGNISFGGAVGVDSIGKGDSSVAVTDTGTNSTIILTVDGITTANVTPSGMTVFGTLSANTITQGGVSLASQADATALAIALGG
jgi:hypothetical protein